MNKLYVAEIFQSIDGEVNGFHQGRMTTFLRLSGCNLKCQFCDSKQWLNKNSGIEMDIDEVCSKIKSFGNTNLTITGGEPLLQRTINLLINRLDPWVYDIAIETNGSMDIHYLYLNYSKFISFVLDYKMEFPDRMNIDNWQYLNELDFIKMVVNMNNINDAIAVYEKIKTVNKKVNIAFSPEFIDEVGYGDEANRIIDYLNSKKIHDVILNLQIHKIINAK